MPDLTQIQKPNLLAHKIAGLNLDSDMVHPQYAGGSILNLPPTICHWLGVPEFGKQRLAGEISDAFGTDNRRVITILMDGLALYRLQRWLRQEADSPWHELVQRGLLAPLTSITPSTTAAAMTSLWTGKSPAEHAVVGYELFLKEYGLVANMIFHSPMSFENDTGGLRRAGFSPETFLGLPTLGTHLSAHGVKTYAFNHASIAHSGLSRMILQNASIHSFSTMANLWINLRDLLQQETREPQYIWVYWGAVDHFSHTHGPDDERTQAEFRIFSQTFKELLLKPLQDHARKGTLLVFTADHGQINTNKDPHYDLRSHPELTRRLHILPTGENRLAYLYIRPGQVEAVREYVERTWPNQFTMLEPAYTVQKGLFGPGRPHPRLLDRMGDLILLSRGSAYLWWGSKENPLLGRHGGLSVDEMLVPFLVAHL